MGDEALQKALERRGMDREEVSAPIRERPKPGSGGIGPPPARIRIT